MPSLWNALLPGKFFEPDIPATFIQAFPIKLLAEQGVPQVLTVMMPVYIYLQHPIDIYRLTLVMEPHSKIMAIMIDDVFFHFASHICFHEKKRTRSISPSRLPRYSAGALNPAWRKPPSNLNPRKDGDSDRNKITTKQPPKRSNAGKQVD